jgi:uncharacterized protein involved in exopolysaccharide biosynthesis
VSKFLRDSDGSELPALRPIRPLSSSSLNRETLTGAVSETDDVTVLLHYLRVLWKHKWIVLLTTVLGMAAGLGFSLSRTPLYTARTSLEIVNPYEPVETGQAGRDLGTKVQLLTSKGLADRVRTKLIETPKPFPKVYDRLSPLRHFLGLKDPATTIEWTRLYPRPQAREKSA